MARKCLDEKIHGEIVWTGTDGWRFEGGYENGENHGLGAWIGPDGERVEDAAGGLSCDNKRV